jgi:short-subunit dehydrogenase
MSNHNKVILITGTSSGIGEATVELFLGKGWKVAATVRKITAELKAKQTDSLTYFELDVTKPATISKCLEQVKAQFGRLDCVVNNAGYGSFGPFEGSCESDMTTQYDVNVFGVMRVTRAAIPYLIKQDESTIINISSIGGRVTLPFYALYNSSKWAVDGFSEGLRYELAKYNIQVKIIEPGPIKTDFYDRSANIIDEALTGEQLDHFHKVKNKVKSFEANGTSPDIVANTIYKAATDNKDRVRYPVGRGVGMVLLFKRLLPTTWVQGVMAKLFV